MFASCLRVRMKVAWNLHHRRGLLLLRECRLRHLMFRMVEAEFDLSRGLVKVSARWAKATKTIPAGVSLARATWEEANQVSPTAARADPFVTITVLAAIGANHDSVPGSGGGGNNFGVSCICSSMWRVSSLAS